MMMAPPLPINFELNYSNYSVDIVLSWGTTIHLLRHQLRITPPLNTASIGFSGRSVCSIIKCIDCTSSSSSSTELPPLLVLRYKKRFII
ncbi:hypothetical protein ACHAXM_010530 [Skeletonema potamos]